MARHLRDKWKSSWNRLLSAWLLSFKHDRSLTLERQTALFQQLYHMRTKIIFITGTDTGVGKSLLTGILLHHLRENGCRALAMKPFCSGGREDVELLQALQPGALSQQEVNPFYYQKPLAPQIAANKSQQSLRLREVVKRIEVVKSKCDYLLIEGSGGVLVPLGKGFNVANLIGELSCDVVVVAHNRLGTLNHTLLTEQALGLVGRKPDVIVLMGARTPDLSAKTNAKMLRKLLPGVKILEIPHLGLNTSTLELIKNSKTITKTKANEIIRPWRMRNSQNRIWLEKGYQPSTRIRAERKSRRVEAGLKSVVSGGEKEIARGFGAQNPANSADRW